MSDPIKHECGIALIRLRKPLSYYIEKYGAPSASILPAFIIDGIKSLFQQPKKQESKGKQDFMKKFNLDTLQELNQLPELHQKIKLSQVQVDSVEVLPDSVVYLPDSVVYDELDLSLVNVDTLDWGDLDLYLSFQEKKDKKIFNGALSKARNVKVNLTSTKTRVRSHQQQVNLYTFERDRKYAMSLACIIMFMIGAPLGAIIKKGGLGVPVIIAIFFFIIYYVIGSIGKQQTKELQLDPYTAAWMANAFLLPFGLFFLRQARIDARLFDVDIYNIWIEKLKTRFAKNSK